MDRLSVFIQRRFQPWFVAALCLAALVLNSGCQAYRALGSGQRIDRSNTRSFHEPSNRQRDMQVEITTDASGTVSNIRFVRSSGSQGVDDYVTESIRTSWQGSPSTKALVELSFTSATGFSEPKLISSQPVQ